MRCTTYCTADSYKILDLFNHLQRQAKTVRLYDGVLHLNIFDPNTRRNSDAFYFRYGCVSFWNFTPEDEANYIAHLEPFQNNVHDHNQDKVEFLMGEETVFDEENDQVILGSDDPLLKLSLSHGLTQSAKLGYFEIVVDKAIESLGDHPNQLATQGKISLSRKKLSQKIGELFSVRHKINLHSDILDTPEFFWRRPRFEPYYQMTTDFMDLSMRIEILNQRLDVIREFYEILSSELNHHHSLRLEIVITLLIAVEVVLALLYKFH